MKQELLNGSATNGQLPEGCTICEQGAKMVLLVTGMCSYGCFYCPLSEEKQGKNVVYADELLATGNSDIIFEANTISALGTGITGGDPLADIVKTVGLIGLLKDEFGNEHHIHLYTADPNSEKIRMLADAGLDEIRFHPPPQVWGNLDDTKYPEAIRISRELGMAAGYEIPCLPDMKDETLAFMKSAENSNADFVNLNELEFSETNWQELLERGYAVKDDVSSGALGSEELASEIVSLDGAMTIHYCSASFKDGVQLRRRILRRAENIKTPLEILTDDGTFVIGIVELSSEASQSEAAEIIENIRNEFEIPDDLIRFDEGKNRIEIAAWVLEEIHEFLDGQCFIVEEYPTADRLEVERSPL